ncbi:hypothetical protein, partial [Psychroserpens sp.]
SFYKIENRSDILRFELDTDFNTTTSGFQEKMTLNNLGLKLANGARVNEFSTDITLSGNSNNAVPSERAVKTYVDDNTFGPVAYGFVTDSGNPISGSGNYTVNWNTTTGRYEITISGEYYFLSSFTTVVTGSEVAIDKIFVTSSGGKLIIFLINNAGQSIQGDFQFVTYK